MKKYLILFTALSVFALSARYAKAEGSGDPNAEDDNDVEIVLTHFEVTDANLDLSWKIKNNTDHDIWTCESISWTSPQFEVFLDKDAKTLVIRRRFNLKKGEGVMWEKPPSGLFMRLRPGQVKTESLSLDVPIKPYLVFGHLQGNAEFACRLALEIEFFNEDLSNLILRIVELAEKLNCDISWTNPFFDDIEVGYRFFRGVNIARIFYDESFGFFRESVMSGGDEIIIPMIIPTMEPLLDFGQVLRIEVDGVSIPYESHYPPLESE